MTMPLSEETPIRRARTPSFLDPLHDQIAELEKTSGAKAIAVALHDEETGASFAYKGDQWFHAASTMKLGILVGVYSAISRGALTESSRLHVRNRFHGALDGMSYQVHAERDSNPQVQAAIGKTMRISVLAHHMIVTSSNLAANLLLDLVGLGEIHAALRQLEVTGIDVRRGVEDERAFDAGINNRATAEGLVQLLRAIIEGRAFSRELSDRMLEILHAQEFRSGIPARLPREVRVAHKTGEISTIAHDAGIVFVPGRKPYVLAVMTEWPPNGTNRSATIATISHSIFERLTRQETNA